MRNILNKLMKEHPQYISAILSLNIKQLSLLNELPYKEVEEKLEEYNNQLCTENENSKKENINGYYYK